MTNVYKLLPRAAWEAAVAQGGFLGAGIDLQDGYIHLSDAGQAAETARLHFYGQSDLVLLRIEAEALGAALKWEPSRGGALFPHLFAPLAIDQVAAVTDAPLGDDGAPRLGVLAP